MKTIFSVNDPVTCININFLPGNSKAPPLELHKEYRIKAIQLDKEGNQHLDVGLVSELEYVSSYETKEQLKDGHKIHWCHPSRFELYLPF